MYIYNTGPRPVEKYVKEYAKSQGAPEELVDRLTGMERVVFATFLNFLATSVKLYWLNKETGEKVLNAVLEPQGSAVITTFEVYQFLLSREGHNRKEQVMVIDRQYGMFQDLLIDGSSFSHDEL